MKSGRNEQVRLIHRGGVIDEREEGLSKVWGHQRKISKRRKVSSMRKDIITELCTVDTSRVNKPGVASNAPLHAANVQAREAWSQRVTLP